MTPSPWQRLKAAYRVYRYGFGGANKLTRSATQAKKIPFIWPSWVNGQPQWQLINYEAYINEGFNVNSIIYSAIMYKTRAVTLAPLRAYTGTMEQPELLPPDHWLQSLCMRPNHWQSWAEFHTQAWVYWLIHGNNFTVFNRSKGQIVEMFNLRPDRVFIMPNTDRKTVIGFWYVPEGRGWHDGIPYLPQDVMHNKLPNPGDNLDGLGYGLSPLSPAAHSGDVDNDLTKFFRLFFKAGAMPSGLLSFDAPMEDDEVSAARRRWNEVYGGSESWAEESVAVLDQGGKYQRIGFTFQEMDVSSIDARNESRLVGPYGVPLTLIESRPQLVQSTYSNKETDRLMFWEDTMEPELNWWQSDWQYYLTGDDGSFVMYDMSATPAYTKRKMQQADRFKEAFGLNAVTVDEYRAILGLPPMPEIVEPESEPLLETAEPESAPMPEVVEEMEEEPPPPDDTTIKKKSRELWAKADKLATSFEAQFAEAALTAFEDDQKYIEAIINDSSREALRLRSTLNWDAVIKDITAYLTGPSLASWQRQITGPVSALMNDRIADLNREYDQNFPAADLLAQEWFNEYVTRFAQEINKTTEETMRRLIQQGISEGWTLPVIIERINEVFDKWTKDEMTPGGFVWFSTPHPIYRMLTLVQTETMKAVNTASFWLYGAWGIQFHEWLAVHDDRTRMDHRAADGQVVRVGQHFNIGGWPMLYPHDPAGPPEQVVNCRCSTAPKML